MYRIIILLLLVNCSLYGQDRTIPVDTMVKTKHTLTIKGKPITYTAITGMQPVWNKKNKPEATLYFTYYKRTDVKDQSHRPIIFSFNGGPGSASVWMHVAYTGPKILNVDDEGYPVQPYGVKDNPYCILDKADIVYVNPVNTGYSRMIRDKNGKLPDRSRFFGINADIKYLAEWMNTFVTRHNRWESPKYIIGESYGGTRVMGLAHELQNSQWMYLNGVIMVSPADYKVLRQGGPVSSALNLPYYTAAAWHHKKLPATLQNKDLNDILPEAEQFAIEQLIPALAQGAHITANKKDEIAQKIAYYSGLDKEEVLGQNLFVTTSYFWKHLLDNGETVGRLDSRYKGFDKKEVGTSPDYNAELSSWLHSFTPAINYYIKNHLKFETDTKYNMFGNVHPWDNKNDNVRENLRRAMAQNPYLKVLVQSGYYDGATTYFSAKYTMWHVDPSGRMKDRFFFKGYRSGHMMYLRNEDLKQANDDIRQFIEDSSSKGKAAKY